MKSHIEKLIDEQKKMLAAITDADIEAIEKVAQMIIDCIEKGGVVYICGNGGSAADAQHIAGELAGRFLRERKALPAVALVGDAAAITAIANDYGFDQIFARQLEGLVKQNDCLWAISTSGSSKNILKAAEMAKQSGAKIVGFVGRKNSLLEKMADVSFCADAEKSYASQQVHQVAYHAVCDLVEEYFAEEK